MVFSSVPLKAHLAACWTRYLVEYNANNEKFDAQKKLLDPNYKSKTLPTSLDDQEWLVFRIVARREYPMLLRVAYMVEFAPWFNMIFPMLVLQVYQHKFITNEYFNSTVKCLKILMHSFI